VRVLSLLVVASLAGCGYCLAAGGGGAVAGADLLAADRAFDEATAARGVAGWVAFFAPDGAMLPAAAPPVVGQAAVREAMAPFFAQPGASLRWTPQAAAVAASGDLGTTWGTSVSRRRLPNGAVVERHGTCVTIWRRQPDGRWKVALDIGNTAPPAPASQP
jgi:ketosteroid isomerase-like protein